MGAKLVALGALLVALSLLALAHHLGLEPRGSRALDARPVARLDPLATPPEAVSGEAAREAVEADPSTSESSTSASSTADAGHLALEIQVWHAGGVARDVRAWLVPGYSRELPADLRDPPPGLEPIAVVADDEGMLRFPALAAGPYRTAIELDGLRLEQAVRLVEGRELTRILIHLGAATIEGFVFDDAGRPTSGTLVHLCRPGYGRNPPPFECFTHTDANGFYRLQQVGSGLQSISVHPGGSVAGAGPRRESIVPFSGVVRLDFGAPTLGGVLWSGVLRNSRGEAVPGPGEIRIHDEAQDEIRTQPLRPDGSFELRLRPGSHHLWVQPAGFFPRQVDLGVSEVPGTDWRQDLVFPGARLCLGLSLPVGWDAVPEITLRAANEGLAALRLVALPDGGWVHDGLTPGKYVLGVSPFAFQESHGPEYAFELGAGAAELGLDLHLDPPR